MKNTFTFASAANSSRRVLTLELLLLGAMSVCMLLIACSPKTSSTQKHETVLFNGKNLDGWIIYGTEKWFVQNGELVCESGPDKGYGYLGTTGKYKNFDLRFDFLQEADGNSGVFIRSSIDGTKITGWQAEVAPRGSHTGGIYESYGRGWLIKPDASLDKILKENDWNKMRIVVQDDVVTTYLNGQQMVELKDSKIGEATGQIALQIHDGGGIRVRWRNIRLQER